MVFLRGLLFLFLHEYPVMEHGPVYMNGDVGWWIRKHDTRLRREEQTIMKKSNTSGTGAADANAADTGAAASNTAD